MAKVLEQVNAARDSARGYRLERDKYRAFIRTIARMTEREPSEEAEIDALDTMNRLIEEARKLLT